MYVRKVIIECHVGCQPRRCAREALDRFKVLMLFLHAQASPLTTYRRILARCLALLLRNVPVHLWPILLCYVECIEADQDKQEK
jgi:hypothetical protein